MPDVLWSRSFEGGSPRIVLGPSQVLVDYIAGRKYDPNAGADRGLVIHDTLSQKRDLVCLDLNGRSLWKRTSYTGLLSLPDGRFLVAGRGGLPCILDADGTEVTRWSGKQKIEAATRHGELLALRAGGTLYVSDLELRHLDKHEYPEYTSQQFACFVDGSFRWVKKNQLWKWSLFGESRRFAAVPTDMVERVMSAVEQATGRPAMPGGSVPLPEDPAEWGEVIKGKRGGGTIYGIGDRKHPYGWTLAFDEVDRLFFLASTMVPHLLVCLDEDGDAKWCRYLFPSCCGGVAHRLPSGLYVTSSGCGGILNWLDVQGQVVFQTDPPAEPSIAYAYSNVVNVLSDGRSLVSGLQGVDAFNPKGELLWRLKPSYSYFDVCEEAGMLFGCRWSKDKATGDAIVLVEAVGNL